jgi:hypothetical protein
VLRIQTELFRGLYSEAEASEVFRFYSSVLVFRIRRPGFRCVLFEFLKGLSPTFDSEIFESLYPESHVHGFFEGLCFNFLPELFGSPCLESFF